MQSAKSVAFKIIFKLKNNSNNKDLAKNLNQINF